ILSALSDISFLPHEGALHDNEHKYEESLAMLANMTLNPEITQSIFEKAQDLNCLTEPVYTGKIKQNPAEGLALIRQMLSQGILPHVRTFIAAFHPDVDLAKFMQLLYETQTVPNTELFTLLFLYAPHKGSPNKTEIVEWASQHCKHLFLVSNSQINRGMCSCGTRLKTIDISLNDKLELLERLSPYDRYRKYRMEKMYHLIIDGGNVAFYNNNTFNQDKIISLINSIHKKLGLVKILIVVSFCRQKLTRKLIGKWFNVEVYYTQANTNDDLCWLSITLAQNILCITNDKIRDHIFTKLKLPKNIMDIWIERHLVSYRFENEWIFNWPPPWSVRPQVNEIGYHIPTADGGWYCSLSNCSLGN
ncbi:MAG: hypothetical protein H0U27_07225, partial [Nitrosopumilus sp.]|nr:hypothetical protein [Nitrosopumilus sp.]